MTQEQFKKELVRSIEQIKNKFSTEIVAVKKVNESYEGLVVKKMGDNIGPTFPIAQYYKEYMEDGRTIENIVEEMCGALDSKAQTSAYYMTKNIMNSEWIKENVQIKVINYERNLEYLSYVPFERYLDLALILYLAVPVADGQGSITIQNHFMEELGLQKDELFHAAKSNINKKKAVVRNIEDILFELLADSTDEGLEHEIHTELNVIGEDTCNSTMYVLSNEENINGTQMLVKQGVLKELAHRLQSEKIYVMPSSIHEVIGIGSKGIDPIQLHGMVKYINQNEVSIQDYLSDSVYLYDSAKDELIIAA